MERAPIAHMNRMDINGVTVMFSPGELSLEEIHEYVRLGKEKHGNVLSRIIMRVNPDNREEVDLEYIFKARPFERIRRITGYLVGTTDRFNNAKQHEEHDRVKHWTGEC